MPGLSPAGTQRKRTLEGIRLKEGIRLQEGREWGGKDRKGGGARENLVLHPQGLYLCDVHWKQLRVLCAFLNQDTARKPGRS